MSAAPNHDEIRDLIAKGWTPPASALKPFSYLIEPFNTARGWRSTGELDEHDCKNLVALIATFDAFGIEIPPKPEAEWIVVLRAFVAEHVGFTTWDCVEAIGGDGCDYENVEAKLREWGWAASTYRKVGEQEEQTRWTKRQVAIANA